ncbi:MAG: DUF512 domain-containing protein, partial [Firmicutes bacterium]|nr:DUF512 domain-containing protein [Bacillota bacterium]
VAAAEPLLPDRLPAPRRVTTVTGVSAAPTVSGIIARLNQVEALQVELAVVDNEYYGHSVTVAGLLTGQDVAAALRGRDLGDSVFLPEVMFREGGEERVTLDNWGLTDLERELGRPVHRLPRDGRIALETLLGLPLEPSLRLPAPRRALAAARARRQARTAN